MQNQNPAFFKILIATDFASVLCIPPLFSKIFGEKLSLTPSLFIDASNKRWTVKIKRSRELYLFTDGWSVFVKDNQLEIGDFLVFSLMDNYSTFRVQLFDRTCCDKQLSSSHFFPGFPGESGENPVNLDMAVRVKKQSETEDKSEMLVGLSNTRTNPSFDIILSASTEIIPKGFVEETGIARKRKMTIQDAQGGGWEIKIRKQDGEFAMCGDGWADFRRANRLSKELQFHLKKRSAGRPLQFHLKKRSAGRPLGHHSKRRL